MKVAYNTCYGGFGLSPKAEARYRELGGTVEYNRDIPRADPILIQVIIELGPEASGSFASLALCEVAPGQRYRIDEYDGNETVMTVDDYEWEIAT